jgi:type II secretory pathway component PulJ
VEYGLGILVLVAIAYLPVMMRIHRRLDRLEERCEKLEQLLSRTNGNKPS